VKPLSEAKPLDVIELPLVKISLMNRKAFPKRHAVPCQRWQNRTVIQ
jgi:hypothetical protein